MDEKPEGTLVEDQATRAEGLQVRSRDSIGLPVQGPLAEETPGRYEVGEELGRGGQSVVRVAYDTHLGREVAFKTLLPEDASSGRSRRGARAARFVREVRVTAQLEHPGIAPVHEVGRRADGTFYATQKLVRGQTLAELLEACRTLADRLRLLPAYLGICQAVAYAHLRGVLHRDLKPRNVMVGPLGETVVIDWGLARALDQPEPGSTEPVMEAFLDDPSRTREGAILGTPTYMSPEQAGGASAQVDARSDVWSLGVILYELLGGRRPYDGESTAEVLRALTTTTPPPVRSVCAEVPPELAAVAERALRRDPEARYQDAGALADEVARWLSGDRVVAYEYRSLELLRRFVRRNRVTTSLALLTAVAVAASALTTRARYLESRRLLAESFASQGATAASGLRWDEAAVWYAASRVQQDSLRARLGLTYARGRAPRPLASRRLEGLEVNAFCEDGDGGMLALAASPAGAQLLDAETGEVALRFGPSPTLAVACAREAGRLVTLGRAPAGGLEVRQWMRPDGRQTGSPWPLDGLDAPDSLSVSADGTLLAVHQWGPPGGLAVHRTEEGARLALGIDAGYHLPAFSSTGHALGWVEGNSLWELARDGPPRRGPGFVGASSLLAVEDGGFVVGTVTGTLQWLPADRREAIASMRGPTGGRVDSLALSGGGRRLASSDSDRTAVTLWDWAQGRSTPSAVLASFGTANHQTPPLALSADGTRLFAALRYGASSTVTVWATPDRPAERRLTDGAHAAELAPDGRRMAVAEARGGPIALLEVPSGRPLGRLPASSSVRLRQTMSFSARGDRLATVQDQPPRVEVFDLEVGAPRPAGVIPAARPPVALSPDGRRVLVASAVDGSLQLWSLDGLELLWRQAVEATGATFSADGSLVAIVGNAWVALLEAATGRERRRWALPVEGLLFRVALSNDGLTLAAGGQSGVWRLDLEAGELIHLGTDCTGWDIALSGDGTWLASSGTSVSLWRRGGAAPVLEFPEEGRAAFVGLSPDGRWLYHAGSRLQVLELAPDAPAPAPESELAEVLGTYRLAFDGQRVAPAGQPIR